MAHIQAQIKRGFLQCLFDGREAAGATLLEVLKAFQSAQFSNIRSGRIVISTSGAGYSTQLKIPQIGEQFSQEQVFAMAQEFREVYSDAVATVSANGGSASDDDQLFACMMADDRLNAQRSQRGDFTLIGLQNSFGSR